MKKRALILAVLAAAASILHAETATQDGEEKASGGFSLGASYKSGSQGSSSGSTSNPAGIPKKAKYISSFSNDYSRKNEETTSKGAATAKDEESAKDKTTSTAPSAAGDAAEAAQPTVGKALRSN